MATLKNDLSLHNLTYEDAIEMAPWISRCGDYWQQAELRTDGACRMMMMMMMMMYSVQHRCCVTLHCWLQQLSPEVFLPFFPAIAGNFEV